MLQFIFDWLEGTGMGKCLALSITFCIGAICGYHTIIVTDTIEDISANFVNKAYASERNDAFELQITKLTASAMRLEKRGLERDIIDNHHKWCGATSQALKDHWWLQLQSDQSDYLRQPALTQLAYVSP